MPSPPGFSARAAPAANVPVSGLAAVTKAADTGLRQADAPSADDRANRDRVVARTLASINQLLDAYFDYNAFQLRPDAIQAVTAAAEVLRQHMQSDAGLRLVVEGHCDERGSAEFNLALGDRRAEAVRDMLSQLGVPANRMTTISYGEAKPACGEANENCWQRNRRAHIRQEQ